jgi:glycosyltransferase involved in cell wall biosynthesis
MIDAIPAILKRRPDAVYVVLGATHPNLVRTQGEAYRESLVARVRALGVEGHVVFLDQFVDQPTLLDFISVCDVYVTPYLNEAQMTSGTGLQLRPRQSSGLHPLLARAGTSRRRPGRTRALWRFLRHRRGNRRSSDQ